MDQLKHTFPYLDNVTIGVKDEKEHDANIKAFLSSVKRHGLMLNKSKTITSGSKISILGSASEMEELNRILKDCAPFWKCLLRIT